MTSEGSVITKAANVVCHVAGSWLNLFVNLSRSVSGKTVATVNDGRLTVKGGEEEWPYVINFTMLSTNPLRGLAKTVADLSNFTGSHYLMNGATSADESPFWSLDGGELFCVKVNVSRFYEAVAAAPRGETVRLVNTTSRIAGLYLVTLSISCAGKAEFPQTYLQSTSNPRYSDSPALPDTHEVGDSSLENPTAVPAVARQLNLSPATPESEQRPHTRGMGALGAGVSGHHGSDGGALTRIDAALYLDSSTRERIRLLFYPDRYHGNLFKRDVIVPGGIGVQLLIQLCEPGDPRVAPAKSERRRNSSSTFALSVPKRRESRVEAATNVDVEFLDGPGQRERCLVIAFNGEETHGHVDVGALLEQDGYVRDQRDEMAANRDRAYVVASCKNYTKATYIIDFLATLGQTQMPTEREVYIAVHAFFCQQGLLGTGEEEDDYHSGPSPSRQSVLEALRGVDMEEVRDHVFSLHSYVVDRASLPERQDFSLLVWQCTRECIINKVLNREEPLLDQTNIVSEMLLS